MMEVTNEPIISRIDRLDHLLKNLEEIKVGNRSSPRSSSPSTPSSATSGTRTSTWSQEFSPRSREKYRHCRSIDEAISEMEHKGSLLERVSLMEDRLLKVEQEFDSEKHDKESKIGENHKGLKQILKSCVKGKSKGKSKSKSKKISDP